MQKLILPEIAKNESLAVALSGGADSMALAHQLAQTGVPVHALSVDHGLRPESAGEAAQVGVWVSAWPNVTHKVLRWTGRKPKTGIMQAARTARYRLMAAYCRKHAIRYLVVAHHADDQLETLFLRLSHGSGPDGLAGMRAFQPYDDSVTLWRPLLAASHADLLDYCRKNNLPWVEDPSNQNTAFTRARLRAVLAGEGFDAKRLAATQNRIARAVDALDVLADRLDTAACRTRTAQKCVYDWAVLRAEPMELSIRILRRAMAQLVPDHAYGPRLERLESLLAGLWASDKKNAATLAGCLLRLDPRRGTLTLAREKAAQ